MNKSDADKDDFNHNEMEAPEDIFKDVEKYNESKTICIIKKKNK